MSQQIIRRCDQRECWPQWKRMEELRASLVKRGDPLKYVERGKMLLGWKLKVNRLPQ